MKPILLINPAETRPGLPTFPRAVEPMGLLYISGAFQQMGVETEIVDLQLCYGDLTTAYDHLAQNKYGGVGIALASQACLWSALKIAQEVKNLAPQIPLFTGGVFASFNSSWILETSPSFDFVVIGEGETFVIDFVNRQGNWEKISGVHSRHRNTAPDMPMELSGNSTVFPDRSLTQAVIANGEVPSVVVSRGCGGGCSFCCISRYYGSRWQPRPVEQVIEELRQLTEQFGQRRFHLVDDNLFGHTPQAKHWIQEFLEALSRFTPPLQFKTTCRLDDLDIEYIPVIKQAGFHLLKIGIETFCQEAQFAYKKIISKDVAAYKIERLLDAGIHVSLGFIMFDPFCSKSDLENNLDFLLAYPDCWGRHLLHSRLVAYRGTRIADRLEKDGLTTGSSIFGSTWKFRDKETSAIYDLFSSQIQSYLLPLEWALYHKQQILMPVHHSDSCLLPLQEKLKDIWTALFKLALMQEETVPQAIQEELRALEEKIQQVKVPNDAARI